MAGLLPCDLLHDKLREKAAGCHDDDHGKDGDHDVLQKGRGDQVPRVHEADGGRKEEDGHDLDEEHGGLPYLRDTDDLEV